MSTKSVVISAETFQLLSPVYYIARLFCMFPLKWSKWRDTNYVITTSLGYIVYSNAMIIFLVLSSIYGLIQLYKIDVVYTIRLADHTERYVTVSDVVVVLFPSVFGVVYTTIKIDKYVDFIKFLNKIDFLLQKRPNNSMKHKIVPLIVMFFTTSIVIFDLVMWIKISGHTRSTFSLFIYYLPYYVCYYFTVVMEMVYWQFVHSIRIRLYSLRENLIDILKQLNSRKNIVVNSLQMNDSRSRREDKKAPNSSNQISNSINAYQNLIDANSTVNDCYGLIIMIIILGCLIHLLVTPYALYTIILNTGNSIFIVSQSIWMFGHILRLLLIVEPCHSCLNQSNNILVMVCKLLSAETNQENKKNLEIFVLHLAHRPIEFSAFGLTTINRGLLTTIAGAVTTYLVILFQFNDK